MLYKRLKQLRSRAVRDIPDPRLPGFDRPGQPLAQCDHFRNLLIQPGQLAAREACHPPTRRSARIAFPEDSSQLGEAESHPHGAPYDLHTLNCFVRVNAIPALGAWRLCNQPKLFVMANRVGAHTSRTRQPP